MQIATMPSINTLDIANKTVLVREDFNVPLNTDGSISDDARIVAAIPTIRQLIQQGAKVILVSHLGQPKSFDPALSLQVVADYLSKILNQPVRLINDWMTNTIAIKSSEVVLLENIRFLDGETKNSPELSQMLAKIADVYVMDAFATAHRAHASTTGVIKYIKNAVAGPLLLRELQALEKIMQQPKRPIVAIVGGAKVSTKLEVLRFLIPKVDTLILGGGIANTFLLAQGYNLGKSLVETNLKEVAAELINIAKQHNCHLLIPEDVIVAREIKEDALTREITMNETNLHPEELILDIGTKTIERATKCLNNAATILWNGPVGLFEMRPFSYGTQAITRSVANSTAYSVAGGGDTLSAIAKFGSADNISYISTGGGAFLECLEGKTLPAIAALLQKNNLTAVI